MMQAREPPTTRGPSRLIRRAAGTRHDQLHSITARQIDHDTVVPHRESIGKKLHEAS
jgi:hypothetical protein